jgi:hypothetical protein
VLDALQMAVDSRRMDGAVLFHTDRGVQYACDAMPPAATSNCTGRGHFEVYQPERSGFCRKLV